MSTLVNPFNPDWRQCAVMSERVVDKLLQNEKEDKFTLILTNGSYVMCDGDQLKPKLETNDSIKHLEEDLREQMRNMQYANFT